MQQIENQINNKTMKYYENNDDERTDRIWDLFIKTMLVLAVIAMVIGYFTIDFDKIDNNIKIEKNER